MSPPSRENPNGVHPPPLKPQKDLNLAKKRTATAAATVSSHRPPVIIYTHSPKVIHAQACDFMAIVQKLTGLSRPPGGDNDNGHRPLPPFPVKNYSRAGLTRKRKAPSPAKKKKEVVEPLDDALLLLPPYTPAVIPATTNLGPEFNHPPPPTNYGFEFDHLRSATNFGFEFDHLPSDMTMFMQGLSPEFMCYSYNEMQPGSSSSPSNVDSSTSTFTDL